MKFSYLLILITLLISGCLSDSTPPPPPTDEELIQTLNEKKHIFSTLIDKICKDGYKVVSVDPEWSDPENIPTNIKQEYYDLLRQVNVSQIRKVDENTVIFPVWATGNVSGGDSKGYIFKPNIDWSYNDKDSLNNISQPGEFFYKRKIDVDWYLYCDRFL